MRLTKKDKDLLYQMINFYTMDYKEIKNKFYLIKTEEEYNKAYNRILEQMETLKEEILK